MFADWESQGLKEVTLDLKTSAKSFNTFLQYLYTGTLNYRDVDDEGLLDLLSLCDEFGIWILASELASAAGDKDYINIWNVWAFFKAAHEYQLQDLHDSCLKFMDTHALECLNNDNSTLVSMTLFKMVLSRDTLFAKEFEILKALLKWLKRKSSHGQKETETGDEAMDEAMKKDLFSTIRWSLITPYEFEEDVKPTGLVSEEFYNKAREGKEEKERFNSLFPPSRYRD
jgi:hypothetical protein